MGIEDGTVDLFAFFWANPNEDWRIAVGLEASNMMLVRDNGAQQAELTHFDAASGAMMLSSGNVAMYRVYLGRIDVSNGTAIDVFVNDQVLSTGGTGATRTWYDGVGYARVVVPEPGAALPALLAGTGALRRRRQQTWVHQMGEHHVRG
jgi:MYXO-CTERM domain-containing protein